MSGSTSFFFFFFESKRERAQVSEGAERERERIPGGEERERENPRRGRERNGACLKQGPFLFFTGSRAGWCLPDAGFDLMNCEIMT